MDKISRQQAASFPHNARQGRLAMQSASLRDFILTVGLVIMLGILVGFFLGFAL